MRTSNSVNLGMLIHVAKRLDELRDAVVFVGGAIVDLLITDPSAPQARPTTDIDVIVEVASVRDYHKLGEHLRALGFREDSGSEDGPMCRWLIDGTMVDIMPVEGQVIGFSNEHYAMAVKTAVRRERKMRFLNPFLDTWTFTMEIPNVFRYFLSGFVPSLQ